MEKLQSSTLPTISLALQSCPVRGNICILQILTSPHIHVHITNPHLTSYSCAHYKSHFTSYSCAYYKSPFHLIFMCILQIPISPHIHVHITNLHFTSHSCAYYKSPLHLTYIHVHITNPHFSSYSYAYYKSSLHLIFMCIRQILIKLMILQKFFLSWCF